MIRLALFQPEIAPNAGTIFRLAACLGLGVDIIEPAAFPVSDRAFRRAGMDYIDQVEWHRHDDFAAFRVVMAEERRRLVLLTTRASTPYPSVQFRNDDVLLVGRESAGAPPYVHDAADIRVAIPMAPLARSLNVAVALAMVAGEAVRQTRLEWRTCP